MNLTEKQCELIYEESHKFQENSTALKTALYGKNPYVESLVIGTPENPMGETLSLEENNKRRKDFEAHLKELHLIYKKIQGVYNTKEKSYVIFNMRLQDAEWLFGFDHFDQESFFYAEKQKDEKGNGFMHFGYYEKKSGDSPFKLLDSLDCIQALDKDVSEYFSNFHDFKFKIPMKIFESTVEEGARFIENLISYKADEKLFEKIHQTVHETVLTRNSSIHRAFLYESEKEFHERIKRIGGE